MKIVGVFPLDVAVLAAIVAVSSTVRVRGSSFVETERNLGKSSKTSTSHDSDEGWNQYSPGPGWYGGHFHGHYPPWGGGSHSGWYGSGHDGWHGGHESESHSTSGKSGKGSKRSGGKSSKSSNSKSSKGSSSKSSKSSSSSSSEEGGHWVWVEYSHHHGHSHGWSDDGWSGSDYSGKSGKSGSGKSGKSGSGSGKSGKSDSGGSGSSVDWSDVDWSDDGWSDEDEEATSHHHVPYDGYAWKGDEWYGHHYDHNNYGYYGNGGIDNHVTDICHASCEGDVCTYHMKVNLYQSEFGFFTFEECDPDLFMPTIALELGKTYRFIQSERTNYFHPVGFAYAPDGVFLDNPEIDEFTAPPGTDNGCEESNSCPTARYFLNDDEIGLGMYEPMMAHPIHEWANYGTFYAELNFPEGTGYEQDLFYFCHISFHDLNLVNK